MNAWPALRARAFFFASSIISSSVPDQRTSAFCEASQKATPNLMPGTALTRASWMSSTVLMKWECPRMMLTSSGFSMRTTFSSMQHLLGVRRIVWGCDSLWVSSVMIL